jgi:peptide/nickel transport system substrate-binding protein
LYEKAMMEPDDAGRRELYARLDSILVSQAPFVILYYDKLLRLVQKDISGLTPNAMNLLVLKHVRKNTSRSE